MRPIDFYIAVANSDMSDEQKQKLLKQASKEIRLNITKVLVG